MKSFSIKTWNNNGVEALKYDGKKWINEKQLRSSSWLQKLTSNKTQYCSDELKKRRCEIQDCEDFQPCRKPIADKLAPHLISLVLIKLIQ